MEIDIIKLENSINEGVFDLSVLDGIDFDTLSSLVSRSNILDDYLGKMLPKDKYSLEQISNNVLSDYAILKDKIVTEDEKMVSSYTSSENLFFKEMDEFKRLSKEENLKYVALYHESKNKGNEKMRLYYRDILLKGNLPLVVFIAKKYRNLGLEFLELISEGSMGLMNAIDKFDLSYGNAFSTYAFAGVKTYIKRAIDYQGNVIRRPVHYIESLSRLKMKENEFLCKNGRMPNNEELANSLNWEVEKVEHILSLNSEVVPFDKTIKNDDTTTIGEMLRDPNEINPEDEMMKLSDGELLKEYLKILSKREQEIIIMRYGLRGEPKTLEEIGVHFHLTRERIRQIEAKAFRKIRVYASRKTGVNDKQFIDLDAYDGMHLKDILGVDNYDIEKLASDPRNILLKEIFGASLTKRADFTYLDYNKKNLLNKFVISYRKKRKAEECYLRGLKISTLTGICQEYINKYYYDLDYKSRSRYLLSKYFGVCLNEPFSEKCFVDGEIAELINILENITASYNKFMENMALLLDGKYLSEILYTDQNTVTTLLSDININSLDAKILFRTFGGGGLYECVFDELSCQEILELENAIKWCKQKMFIINNNSNAKICELYEATDKLLDSDISLQEFFKEAINLLPPNIRVILEYKMGVYGKMYSLEEIAKIFSINDAEVTSLIEQGEYYLNYIINEYKARYKDMDIPNKQQILTRMK